MTRAEHLQWAKGRALEYFNRGELQDAVASMASDVTKHDEMNYPSVILQLGLIELMNGNRDGIKRWIEGFN